MHFFCLQTSMLVQKNKLFRNYLFTTEFASHDKNIFDWTFWFSRYFVKNLALLVCPVGLHTIKRVSIGIGVKITKRTNRALRTDGREEIENTCWKTKFICRFYRNNNVVERNQYQHRRGNAISRIVAYEPSGNRKFFHGKFIFYFYEIIYHFIIMFSFTIRWWMRFCFNQQMFSSSFNLGSVLLSFPFCSINL